MPAPDFGPWGRAVPWARAALLAGLVALTSCKDEAPPVGGGPPLSTADGDGPPHTSDCRSWAELDYDNLPALAEAPHMAAFDQVWRTVAQKHYDPTLACLDWVALRATYAERVRAAGDDAPAAYAAINEMLGLLGQSHLHATAPSQRGTSARESGPAVVPINVRWIAREPVGGEANPARAAIVVDAAVGGVATPVPPGAELLEVAGESVTDVAAEVMTTVEARDGRPSEAAFMVGQAIGAMLSCPEGASKTLTVRDLGPASDTAAAKPAEIEVPCVLPEGERISLGNLRNLPTTVSHRMLGDDETKGGAKLGYLAFNFWMLPMTERVRAGVHELRNQGMQALIIDLRGNPGGVGAMSIPIARLFSRDGASLGRLQMREFNQEFKVEPNPTAFTGPIAILVDEGTASTSEIFAVGMRDIGRVTIVGAGPSAGMALPSMIESLPDGGLVQYVVGDYHSAKGTAAEGEGITPEVTVAEHGTDYASGHDPVLEAAINLLDGRVSDSPSPTPAPTG